MENKFNVYDKNILICGDSLVTGENNDGKGLYHYFPKDGANVKSIACSGSTIGEYSLYPVDGYSLQAKLAERYHFKYQDIIILEYGINDASSICGWNVSSAVVLNTFRKCVDGIRQIAPNSRLVFIHLADNMISAEAEGQINYLENDYLSAVLSVFEYMRPLSSQRWEYEYMKIVELGRKLCDTAIGIMDSPTLLDNDGIHPNDEGYRRIASQITQSL